MHLSAPEVITLPKSDCSTQETQSSSTSKEQAHSPPQGPKRRDLCSCGPLSPVPHTSPQSGPAADSRHPASSALPAPGRLAPQSDPGCICLLRHCTLGPETGREDMRVHTAGTWRDFSLPFSLFEPLESPWITALFILLQSAMIGDTHTSAP